MKTCEVCGYEIQEEDLAEKNDIECHKECYRWLVEESKSE